jgi:hypothetical protein
MERPPNRKPKEQLKVPDAIIYKGEDEEVIDAGKEEEKRQSDLIDLRTAILALEHEVSHPVPGAMKVNHEPKVLELEEKLRSLEAKDPKKKEKGPKLSAREKKMADVRAQIKALEDEAAHPVPGAMKNPERESQILALEAELRELESSKSEKKGDKAEKKETPKKEGEPVPPADEKKKDEKKPVDLRDGWQIVGDEYDKAEALRKDPRDGWQIAGDEYDKAQRDKRDGWQVVNDEYDKASASKEPKAEAPKSLAEQMIEMGQGRQIHYEAAARAMAERSQQLDREAGQKFGEGSKAVGWLRKMGEDYNKLPFATKILLGVAMTGIGIGTTLSLGMPAYVAVAGLTAWRALTSAAAGLGAYTTAEALIQRSKDKKIAAGRETGKVIENKKKVAGAIGVATGAGTFLLGQWLSGAFNGMFGHGGGVEGGHHFDPNQMIEVKKGHGAISMVHDLKAKLDHLYAHTDPKDIPASARAIMNGDPTKIAEQLQAYQPGEALNSEGIPLHAHLGIGEDGSLLYEAHGLDHPVSLLNPDGSHGVNWDDHMMRPGAHHGGPTSTIEKIVVAKAEAAAGAPITHEEALRVAHDAATGQVDMPVLHQGVGTDVGAPGLESATSMWAQNPSADLLHTLAKEASSMQPDPALTNDILGGNLNEPTAYLLQDGRVSVFGVLNSDEAVRAATHFASTMHTDVVLPTQDILHNGPVMDLIVHPDGTTETVARKASMALAEEVVMKLGKA